MEVYHFPKKHKVLAYPFFLLEYLFFSALMRAPIKCRYPLAPSIVTLQNIFLVTIKTRTRQKWRRSICHYCCVAGGGPAQALSKEIGFFSKRTLIICVFPSRFRDSMDIWNDVMPLFLPYSVQFVIHLSPSHLTLRNLIYWQSKKNWLKKCTDSRIIERPSAKTFRTSKHFSCFEHVTLCLPLVHLCYLIS